MPTFQVRNNIINRGSAYIPDVETFTGSIIPNPKWVGDDCLCLSTGDPSFPFRIIRKSEIIGNQGIEPAKQDKNIFAVEGSKGNKYIVTREGASWSCTCVGFGFRRDCKHVVASKKLLNKSK